MAPDSPSGLTTTAVRKPPLLHRNWLAAVGSRARPADHDLDDTRPSKRMRVAGTTSDSGMGLEALHTASPDSHDGQAEKALRIELLKIQHKDTSRFRSNPFSSVGPSHAEERVEAKVRCRIFILGHDADSMEEHQLLIDSQIGTAKSYKNSVGFSHVVRLHLSHTFNVTQDKLLVPRADGVLALAHRYSTRIRLEPAGDAAWPPSFIDSVGAWHNGVEDLPRSKWVLQAEINDLFQWHRKQVPLSLIKRANDLRHTNYMLDVDIRWSSALSAKAMGRLDKGIQHSIVCSGDADPMELDAPDIAYANGVNGLNGSTSLNDHQLNGDGDIMEDADDQAEGDLTPGRRRRPRPQINYNLKLLSDKAQHKERRKRQNQKSRNGASELADDHGVSYTFRDQFVLGLDDFLCVLCGKSHPSFDILCLHYTHLHEDYAFEFSKIPLKVSISRSFGRPATVFGPEEFQLGPPRGILDPQAILEGDDTWITSRQGSENDRAGAPLRTLVARNAPQPVDPNNLTSRRQTKIITVPKTKTTLYHPLSRAVLEPGTPVPTNLADERWLIQKHRDTIGDYTDLESSEIEFMQMWDSFFLPLHLTSELYFPPYYIAFTKEKADWITENKDRGMEFGKQQAVLLIRGVIKDEHVEAVNALLQEARERREAKEREERAAGEQEEPEPEPRTQRKRTKTACAKCHKFVERGPAWIKCSGKNCPAPLWHDYCATDPLTPTDNRYSWKCDHCSRRDHGSQ